MKYIIIDIFKDNGLYKSLKPYNNIIKQVSHTSKYDKGGFYNTKENEASLWFDYTRVRETLLNAHYPEIHPIQLDDRFCLYTHAPNHIALLLIELLYKENRDILIEDICCGMGNLVFFLSKLGYKNFNVIDNFSQLPQELFERLMISGSINYSLNDMSANAVISSLIAYPHYVKYKKEEEIYIPESLELFLSYVPLFPNEKHLDINGEYFFNELDFVPLCTDEYQMLYAYCKKKKYDEFSKKLENIKIGESNGT